MSSCAHVFSFHPSLAKLAALTLAFAVAAPASAQTPVTFGAVITEPGFYFLAGNQTGTGADGITIESDDVVLFLSRFTLRGDGHAGIRCEGNDNVTIWGGRVTGFVNGVIVRDGTGCTVKDMRIDHSAGDGLSAIDAGASWFLRLQTDHNGRDGVDVAECRESRFISIRSHDNGENGFYLGAGAGFAGSVGLDNGSKLRLCWAAYNDRDGIRIENSDDHELVKNQCVNNAYAGIRLATQPFDPNVSASQVITGPQYVSVKDNWCVFNRDGIVADEFTVNNTFTNNIALANFDHDMFDDTVGPTCQNTWYLNFFLTKDGNGEDCIF